MEPLLTHDGPLRRGTVVDRPNRFVVRVRFDVTPERAFLGDPGALEGIVEPGRSVLCSPVDDPDRSTAYDAIAADVGGEFVSLRASLANDLFERAIDRADVPPFEEYTVRSREPPLPDHGRTDFLLDAPDGGDAYVEVKSCTYVEDGVAKFPDRPTERGRRHLQSLRQLHEDGHEAHLVFVIQRSDAARVRPYRRVDPQFADRLDAVRRAGVDVHAISVAVEPPHYRLHDVDVPVDPA